MALDFATSYAEIIKFNKNDDGTITVYGKATSDDLDIDQQICDNDWLSKAMPEWFKSGGNIREQHSSIAAGVAHELETKDDGYYVSAHIVDPTSIKKVEAKVLKGFSIGIKGPRVVRDNKAANGRIIDGQIVEVSLVDRPANPTCQLVLAKSVGGESTLTQVEDLIEKYNPDQERDDHGRFGSGRGNDNTSDGRDNKAIQDLAVNVTEHTDDISEIVTEAEDGVGSPLRGNDQELADQAQNLIDSAATLLDQASDSTVGNGSHYTMLERASSKLDDAATSLLNANNRGLNNVGKDIQGTVDQIDSYLENMANNVKAADAKKSFKETIEKYNENQERDERGRFGASDSPKNPTSGNGYIPNTGDVSGKIENGYLQALNTDDESSKLDAAQVRDDAYNHIQDAQNSLSQGKPTAASKSMQNAAEVLDQHPAFKDAAKTARQMAEGLSKTKSASVALQYNFTNKSDKDYETMKNALLESIVEMEKSVAGDKVKFDQASYDVARRGIAQLIISEAGEIAETDSDERDDIGTLLSALKHLFNFRDGELDEDQDAVSDMAGSIAGSMINLAADGDSKGCDCDGCAACQSDGGCDSDICKGCKKMSAKSAKIDKCLECGCHDVSNSHGLTQVVIPGATPTNEVANVTTATSLDTSGSIKSAEGEEVVAEDKPAEEKADELVDAELPTSTEILDEKSVSAIIEKAVKSATDTVKAEIAEYEAASKAAEQKVMALESELVAAKSAARSGGPKRTGRSAPTDTNELLLKAAEYRLKASATSDQILAKGYKALEKEYLAKAGTPDAE